MKLRTTKAQDIFDEAERLMTEAKAQNNLPLEWEITEAEREAFLRAGFQRGDVLVYNANLRTRGRDTLLGLPVRVVAAG